MAKLVGLAVVLLVGLAILVGYAAYEAQAWRQQAVESVATAANTRAAALQEWLLRVDRTLSWFRVEDLATADRIASTVRMLHNERFVAPARTLFLVSASGRLVAGTLPLPDEPTAISARRWFKALAGAPRAAGIQMTACTHDPFGGSEGVVIYRAIIDRDVVAGYVGSFLPQSAIAAMVRDDDALDGVVQFALRSEAGEGFGCHPSDGWRPVVQHAGLRGWFSGAVQAWPQLNRRNAVTEERVIEPGGLHLIAAADALDAMSEDAWLALTYRAAYVVVSLVLIMALLASMLMRHGPPARNALAAAAAHDAADGADWMWELDESGHLVGLAGNVPDHLLPPSRQFLAETAGPIGSKDMRWERFNAAIHARQPFEGLHVPFQIPGRPGTLTIFAVSGQPVVSTGGFWGTASLVSEEGMARPARPSIVRAMLSMA